MCDATKAGRIYDDEQKRHHCERLLTYYGLNNDCESETEDNGEDGLSVTSAETTINRPNAHVGLKD